MRNLIAIVVCSLLYVMSEIVLRFKEDNCDAVLKFVKAINFFLVILKMKVNLKIYELEIHFDVVKYNKIQPNKSDKKY